MDNTKSTSLRIAEVNDLRQSENWAKYLHKLGWNTYKTKSNVALHVRKTILGGMAKIQRPPKLSVKNIEEIQNICKKENITFITIEPNLKQNLALLKDYKYKSSVNFLVPTRTIFIDLTLTEKELWNNLTNSCKYSINRAKRENNKVNVTSRVTDHDLAEFVMVQRESANKNKFMVEKLEDLIYKRDIFGTELLMAKAYNNNNEICGINIYLAYKNNVWYMHGGTSKAGRKSKAGYLLVWESLRFLKNNNYEFLDLEGVDDDRVPSTLSTWGGFSHFKEKFGGITVEYPLPQVKFNNKILSFFRKRSAV